MPHFHIFYQLVLRGFNDLLVIKNITFDRKNSKEEKRPQFKVSQGIICVAT